MSSSHTMRVLHRYLGFFLAGIMAVYAVSGIIMIYRNTDFLKKEVIIERQIAEGLSPTEAGEALRIRNFQLERQEGDLLYFNGGTYDPTTGAATVVEKTLPYVLKKMTDLHKATTKSPLYFLNIFFGTSLMFFVVSAFWMFLPGSRILRKGLLFTAGGIVLTLVVLFV